MEVEMLHGQSMDMINSEGIMIVCIMIVFNTVLC